MSERGTRSSRRNGTRTPATALPVVLTQQSNHSSAGWSFWWLGKGRSVHAVVTRTTIMCPGSD